MRDNYGPCAVPRKGTPGWCRHQTTSRHGAAGRARIVTGRTRPDDLAEAVRLDAPATRHRLDEEQATTGRRLLVRLGEEWHPVTGVGDATRRTSAGQASRSSSRSSLCRAALVTSSLTASSAAAAVSPITPHSSTSCLVNRRASVTAAGDGGSRRTIRRAPESLVSEVTRAATSAMSSSPVGARHASSSSASCSTGSCSDDASTARTRSSPTVMSSRRDSTSPSGTAPSATPAAACWCARARASARPRHPAAVRRRWAPPPRRRGARSARAAARRSPS